MSLPNTSTGQGTAPGFETNLPDDYHDFNHFYNIELCIMRCINAGNDPQMFVNAVNIFEITLISDLTSKLQDEVQALNKRAEQEMGVQAQQLRAQYQIAMQKYRLLYAFMKQRSVKAVMAVGRPKCHACGVLILWNKAERTEARRELGLIKERPEVVADVALPEE